MLLGARQFFEQEQAAPAWTNPYVTDGLVAMWDGEWNAGGGVHDANATTWNDCVDGVMLTPSGIPTWTTDGLYGNGISFGANIPSMATLLETGKYSVEVCIGESRTARNENGLVAIGNTGSGSADRGGVYMKINTGSNTALNVVVNSAAFGRNNTYTGNQTFSMTANAGSNFSVFGNGSLYWNQTATVGFTPPNDSFSIGRFKNVYTYNTYIDIHCVRVYSRALSADEIAANYAIDKARFNLP